MWVKRAVASTITIAIMATASLAASYFLGTMTKPVVVITIASAAVAIIVISMYIWVRFRE